MGDAGSTRTLAKARHRLGGQLALEPGQRFAGVLETVYLGAFKRARAELGVESFGMAVIDLPPDFDQYPAHDHSHDRQEEVFLALRGSGEIEIDGERFPLDDNHIARVAWEARRKIISGPDGIRVLALSGCPGKLYEAPDVSKLGQPDPMATS